MPGPPGVHTAPRRADALARGEPVDELLSRAIAAGRLELIHDYALPIPFPAEDHPRFHRGSSFIVAATASPNLFRVLPAIWRFVRYIRRMIAAKRACPQDDLTSALVQAHAAGDRLRGDELVAMVFLVVVAGTRPP